MKITSPLFKHSETIPAKFTCDGENINPFLEIGDVPVEAKSLALIMDDPDAPRGTFVHWVMWNIDPSTREIAEGSVPGGALQGANSAVTANYIGPCPPSGTHRYFFKLYALDVILNLPKSADKAELEKAMDSHILAQAELIGLYSRG